MKISKEHLYDLYVVQEMSQQDICKVTGVATTTILRYLKAYDISRRTVGATSARARQKVSVSHKGCNNHNFGKKASQHGKRCWYTTPNGDTVSMRSQWEVWYAEYLQSNGIYFDYEPKTFILSDGSAYTPDFYIPSDGAYVEVKGWFTNKHKEVMRQFLVDFPMDKLVLADKPYLLSLGIDLRKRWIAEKPMFPCERCNRLYHRGYPAQRFCGIKCRNGYNRQHASVAEVVKSKRNYKGSQSGEKNNGRKLSLDIVNKIKELRSAGHAYQQIADQTGATPGNISNIVRGKSWAKG